MAGAPITLTASEERLLTDLPEGEVRETLRAQGLPNRRVEAWRWSDIRAALRDPREPSGPYAYDATDAEPLLSTLGGTELVIANGLLRAPTAVPTSLRIHRGDPAPAILPDAPVASLATASMPTEIAVEGSLDAPLFIRRLSEGNGAHADRVRLTVAPGASVTVIEVHRMKGAPFVNSLSEITLAKGARMTRIVLQPGTDDAVLVATGLVRMDGDASLEQLTITGGAALSRHEMRLSYAAAASARIDGLYALDGTRHADLTTRVDHTVPGAVTSQLVKGLVRDRARGVFQGKFHVSREGQQTDAKMAHHALLLSAAATVSAKPELEIYADDVECAHGNTAGALDPEALFYLRQRGLSDAAAQDLLVEAFLDEVFGQLSDENLAAAVRQVAHAS